MPAASPSLTNIVAGCHQRRWPDMSTPRLRKPRSNPKAKPAPDPKVLLAKLHTRLEKEQAALHRWQKRMLRVFHAFERQSRLTTRLQRRIAKLESA
jgi:hypothetical protein